MWGFFNLPFSLPPPHNEQKSRRMTSKVQGRQRCQCPLWLDRGQHQQLRFYGDRWQPKHQWQLKHRLMRSCRKEDTFLLKYWEPALLLTACHRLKETKLPSFLVYVNCKDEKSLLKVICNKNQRIQVLGSCERSQRIFKFWGQRNARAEY